MKIFLCILFYFTISNFTNSCFTNNGSGIVNPTTTTISPNIDDMTKTTTSISTTTIADCSSCTTNQITFTRSTSPTTEDATYSNYELDQNRCYTITAICDVSDSPTALSFMQVNFKKF